MSMGIGIDKSISYVNNMPSVCSVLVRFHPRLKQIKQNKNKPGNPKTRGSAQLEHVPVSLFFLSLLHQKSIQDKDRHPRSNPALRLRHVQSLTTHEAAVNQEQEHDGVDLERGAREPSAAWHGVEDAVLRHPPGHEGVEPQRRGDGRALEVARLARRILGDVGCRDVEAGQAREAAEHEDGETGMVEGCAEADAEGHTGWS